MSYLMYSVSLPRTVVLPVLVLLLSVAGGCASDGKELAAAQAWQTTTTRPLPPTSAPDQATGIDGMTLSSPDFAPGGEAPVSATCGGANLHPAFQWTNLPEGAAELGITLSDQTDPENPLLLWLMAGLNPAAGELIQGDLPAGAFETLNDYGQPGWGNPCLEEFQNGRRDLQFRLYVLDRPSEISPGAPGNTAWDELAARSIDSATVLMRITSNSG